jgi:DNA-directed RNA polymerase specialized sigma24 family protein
LTFEEFVAVRLPALVRQATVLAGDPHVAEDVVQDVLVKAQPRWARIRTLDAPESYCVQAFLQLNTVNQAGAAELEPGSDT